MDGPRFDALTRTLSGPGSRRRALAGLAAAALAACGVRGAAAACRPAGAACRENANCCAGKCAKDARGRRTCLPPPEGTACPLPGGDFGVIRGGACVGSRGGCTTRTQCNAVVPCPNGGACGFPTCDVTVEGALVCNARRFAFLGGCPGNACEATADCPATAACFDGTCCPTPACILLCGVGPTGAGVSEDEAGPYRS
jgi:hypothetical protein